MNTQRIRQTIFFGAVLIVWAVACMLYALSLGPRIGGGLDGVLQLIFGLLSLQIVFGGASALAGFAVLKTLPHASSQEAPPVPSTTVRPTAIIVPIYHEDPARVFLGIRRVLESLQSIRRLEEFDVFVLSDSQDPNAWVEEEKEWLQLIKDTAGVARVFYRRRRGAIHQKSGNVADFCRRWGKNYRYMIVLDADSVMTGSALCQLVKQMEQRPDLGIIQSLPRQVLGRTVFARAQQFGNWLYGAMFAAGSRYWHGQTGPYWGHNAIIRVEPFMRFCALPEIPRVGPFHGRFMSHDSVEAAFMGRAGYGVWLNYELDGSYEEGPPDVAAAMKRDVRWCRGNLQHVTLLGTRGLRWESRVLLLAGIMGYASAPIWLLFIVLTLVRPVVTSEGEPSSRLPAMLLLGLVLFLLFLPKALGLALKLTQRQVRRRPQLLASVVVETFLSALLAPVQMISHSYAVLAAIAQFPARWSGQDRRGDAPGWFQLGQTFGAHTALGVTGLWLVWRWHPGTLPWILPVLVGLIASVPLARVFGSVSWGERSRYWGLFLAPEELAPPRELRDVEPKRRPGFGSLFETEPYKSHHGILQVVLDPYVHAAHVALLRSSSEVAELHAASLAETLFRKGPQHLSAKERLIIMGNFDVLIDLHRRLWTTEPEEIAPWWQMALRHYNESMALNVRRSLV